MTIRFGMIGGGVMGEALLARLIGQNVYRPQSMLVSEPGAQRREVLAQRYGVAVTASNCDAAKATEVVMLAIKPQSFAAVAQELAGQVAESTLVLSILAGTTLARLTAAFPHQPVIRAMPNTPAQVGQGITAIALSPAVQPQHLETAQGILQTVGQVVEVPEALMDAVTGLSGSGPGYVALVIEALSDGGVAVGLPRAIATQLAIQTVLGTATLLQEQGLHPGQLKDQVTSPGGTTIAGIAQLEKQGLRSALIEAVGAATARSRELGQ